MGIFGRLFEKEVKPFKTKPIVVQKGDTEVVYHCTPGIPISDMKIEGRENEPDFVARICANAVAQEYTKATLFEGHTTSRLRKLWALRHPDGKVAAVEKWANEVMGRSTIHITTAEYASTEELEAKWGIQLPTTEVGIETFMKSL